MVHRYPLTFVLLFLLIVFLVDFNFPIMIMLMKMVSRPNPDLLLFSIKVFKTTLFHITGKCTIRGLETPSRNMH